MPEPRFDYRRFYDCIAPVYAAAQWALPVWRRYTHAVLPWLPESRAVLEIGPGAGLLHTLLARKYPFAVALDLAPRMLHETRARLHRTGKPARLVQADAQHLPFARESFDGVALTFVFSAIPDGAAALREMARVLRPGGVIALVDACEPHSGNPVGMWLARQWERFGDFMRDEAALMRAAGLDVIHCREFGAFDSIRITVGRKGQAGAAIQPSRDAASTSGGTL